VLSSTSSDHRLTITNVYAPSDHRDSPLFLDGLKELKPHINGAWLLLGDFNLVRSATDKNNCAIDTRLCQMFNDTLDHLEVVELPLLDTDKNNCAIDTRLCQMFNDTLDHLEVVELPLLDKLFTWSNQREHPTLARLDRVFANHTQCTVFPNTSLTSLVWPTSNHTPLSPPPYPKPTFFVSRMLGSTTTPSFLPSYPPGMMLQTMWMLLLHLLVA